MGLSTNTLDVLISAYEVMAKDQKAPDSIFLSTEVKNKLGEDYILNARVYHHESFDPDNFIMGSLSGILKYFDTTVDETGRILDFSAFIINASDKEI